MLLEVCYNFRVATNQGWRLIAKNMVYGYHTSSAVVVYYYMKRRAKACTTDSYYNERLCMLNLTTLNDKRRHLKLCSLYKIFNGQVFLPNSPIRYRPKFPQVIRSHHLTLQVPYARTSSCYHSFFCQTPRLWNGLPIEAVSSVSAASFKRACWNL